MSCSFTVVRSIPGPEAVLYFSIIVGVAHFLWFEWSCIIVALKDQDGLNQLFPAVSFYWSACLGRHERCINMPKRRHLGAASRGEQPRCPWCIFKMKNPTPPSLPPLLPSSLNSPSFYWSSQGTGSLPLHTPILSNTWRYGIVLNCSSFRKSSCSMQLGVSVCRRLSPPLGSSLSLW